MKPPRAEGSPEAPDLSIILPTRNEEASLGLVLEELRTTLANESWTYEVLVVDTLSTDRTVEIARSQGARVVAEDRRGYGHAYMTGFAQASGHALATLDADFTYPGTALPELLHRLEAENLDFISGERLSHLSPEAMSVAHRLGNVLLNLVIRLLYRVRVRDSQSGMWVLRRTALESLRLTQTGMAFSQEIKLEAVRRGLRFREVPIGYRPRVGKSELRAWSDGVANLRHLVLRRIQSSPD